MRYVKGSRDWNLSHQLALASRLSSRKEEQPGLTPISQDCFASYSKDFSHHCDSGSTAMTASTADGRLHRYWPERNLTLFEYLPSRGDPTRGSPVKSATLIFVGGLYDSFLSVPYVPLLASYINQCPDWGLMEIQLSSSGLGWGACELHVDVEEIGRAVQYVRERVRSSCSDAVVAGYGGRVVLMGHSTGSQDVLHYLYHKSEQKRPPVDGAILQAPVSDREGIGMMREQDQSVQQAYEECLRISLNSGVQNALGKICCLPSELTSLLGWHRGHVSCKRFFSLASPFSPIRPEADDLFSSDLSDEALSKTFGEVGESGILDPKNFSGCQMLVLLSAEDEYTPKRVNKETLIDRWKSALEEGGTYLAPSSGVVADASHNVSGLAARFELTRRVLKYLADMVGGVRIPAAIFAKLNDDLERLDGQC
jgi:Protein of unknown function (DUF1749)